MPPPGGFGGPGGGRGPGPGGPERKLLERFDADRNQRLDYAERQTARATLREERSQAGMPGGGPGGRGPGGPGGMFGAERPATGPGERLEPDEVAVFPKADLHAPDVLRTLFLEFQGAEWEAELADFYNSDVEVPATLVVDGKRYLDVGVHFRGASSYFMVPAGAKRSLDVALDFVRSGQRLYGSKTLNLLNCNEDPSFLSSVLYATIARKYLPVPKASLVRVVINGECWGVYCNLQQFDRLFVSEHFGTTKGARWKVKGSPGGGGGLDYLGDDPAAYKSRYQLKSEDRAEDWQALVALCKTLSQAPVEELERKLPAILNVDRALRFLALDLVLLNSDGYWIRASDYSLYLDPQGVFQVVPHDMNEAFRPGGGPGFSAPGRGGRGGAPQGGGLEVDPLIGLTDARKPLRSRLLAVPAWRTRYLEYVREIAQQDLDWDKLGPLVASQRQMIAEAVAKDTRKLVSTVAFLRATADTPAAADGPPVTRGRGPAISLREFADRRRKFLLEHPEIRALDAAPPRRTDKVR